MTFLSIVVLVKETLSCSPSFWTAVSPSSSWTATTGLLFTMPAGELDAHLKDQEGLMLSRGLHGLSFILLMPSWGFALSHPGMAKWRQQSCYWRKETVIQTCWTVSSVPLFTLQPEEDTPKSCSSCCSSLRLTGYDTWLLRLQVLLLSGKHFLSAK